MELKPGNVLIWWMQVASPPAIRVARWRALLDRDEQARADRFRFAVDRDEYIAGHAMCRTMLAAVGMLPPTEWRFIIGPLGKPEIDPALGSRLRFNLSHTRGLVAAAVCLEDDLGIDVEDCHQKGVSLDAAGRLAPTEITTLYSVPERHRFDTFFNLWTLKEAYLKATGDGLARELSGFAFTLDPIDIRFNCSALDNPAAWQFFQWRPTRRHVLALALHHAAREQATLIRCAIDEGQI